jgi:hypothetical protein
LLIVAILVVVGIFVYREKQARDAVTAPAFSSGPVASSSSTTVRNAPLVQHPIGPAGGSTAGLPPLDQSDDDVLAGLMGLTSDGALKSLLRPEAIVSRMVSTIDALPKQSVGMNVVPLRTPTGRFQVVPDDGNFVASKKNTERYATYMYVADRMDTKAATAWYKRNYPLFQQAYRDLGTNGYFNDRLIEVIDHMLAAPEPMGNQQLLPEKVGYVYANQALEQLSVGQKFMIRLGPENEAKLKAKLRALREEVANQSADAPPEDRSAEAPSRR